MRLTCLIDSLGSGGAQRQLCLLAVLLKQRGIDVSVLTYHPFDFFLPMLRAAGVPHQCVQSRSILGRILSLRRALRRSMPDVVLAFLDAPCLYAELAALPWRKWGLVVSERSANPALRTTRARWLRQLHRVADYVTANSHTNRLMLERIFPALCGRVFTVYNTVDLQAFTPRAQRSTAGNDTLRFVAVSSYQEIKNIPGVVTAFALVRAAQPDLDLRLDWYGEKANGGGRRSDRSAYECARTLIRELCLQDRIHLHPPSPCINEVYSAADALILPSFYEGLPNVVCEAMACGRPILMSNVCDAGNLVCDGRNGLLFDPHSPDDIARAILRFAAYRPADRAAMGGESRSMAERMFAPAPFATRYLEILEAAAARRRVRFDHWVPEVPDSAQRSVLQ